MILMRLKKNNLLKIAIFKLQVNNMIKTYVTGHDGMVGSAIIRELKKQKIKRILKIKEQWH